MWRSFLRAQFGWLGGLPVMILWLGTILLSVGLHLLDEWMNQVNIAVKPCTFAQHPMHGGAGSAGGGVSRRGRADSYLLNLCIFRRTISENVDASGKDY